MSDPGITRPEEAATWAMQGRLVLVIKGPATGRVLLAKRCWTGAPDNRWSKDGTGAEGIREPVLEFDEGDALLLRTHRFEALAPGADGALRLALGMMGEAVRFAFVAVREQGLGEDQALAIVREALRQQSAALKEP